MGELNMNYGDYLCNSLAIMLMSGMSHYYVEFEYDEKENPNYDKIYDKERSALIDRLMQEAFDQCVKDYEIFAISDEKLDDLDDFCNQMVDAEYDKIVEQAENELRSLDIKRYIITLFDITTKDKYTDVLLECYYNDVDNYGHVDRYDITEFNMGSDLSHEEDHYHFRYRNKYWETLYHGPELDVFL